MERKVASFPLGVAQKQERQVMGENEAFPMEDFGWMVRLIIKMNQDVRKERNVKAHLSPLAYAMEHCTVHLNAGRCTGKTYFIEQFLKQDNNAVVIVHDFSAAVRYREKGIDRELIIFIPNDPKKIPMIPERARLAKTIFIDEPRHVFSRGNNELRLRIYDAIANPDIEQTFVLLGE
jgi:hypothetical protein